MVALAAYFALAVGQTSHFSPAHFAAEKATEVAWNPEEKYLSYLHKTDKGRIDAIGLYDIDHEQGKTLFNPSADQNVEAFTWLAGRPVELVSTVEPAPGREKPSEIRTVWALDGVDMSLKKLWSREFTNEENASLSIDASPSLAHALVTVSTKAGSSYFVVTLGAKGMVFSQDATQASKQGQNFAGWSVDGTALFGPYAQAFSGTLQLGALAQYSRGIDILATLADSSQGTATSSQSDNSPEILNRFFVTARPSIEAGASVYELMPTNGSLRSIRYHGYWKDAERPNLKLVLLPNDNKLTFKNSTGGTHSLWLADDEDKPQNGELVSPQAEQGWLAPRAGSVAFTLNGVLFVRKLKLN